MTAAVVVRRTGYPQAVPRAEDLVTGPAAVLPDHTPIETAIRLLARRRGVLVRRGRDWAFASAATLARARSLGLGPAALRVVLWDVPAVGRDAPEVAVRQRLGPSAPVVVVVAGDRVLGVVERAPGAPRHLPWAGAARLATLDAETTRLLRLAGAIGAARGWAVAAVGGLVRDLVLGRARAGMDLDLAVEGDGPALADALGGALGGRVVRYPAFLTARLTLPNGRRVDVATARRERYGRPGALPQVEPAPLLEDLGRRDFTVNALALRLEPERWGEGLDPWGGLADLRGRRIRVLHPLSFVEDPTRVLRAVRFAGRLGFRLERGTVRLLREAARLPVYGALSGERLREELERVFTEPRAETILARLARLGALRLVVPGYRCGRRVPRILAAAAATARVLPLDPRSRRALYHLALTADLDQGGWQAWADRLRLAPAVRVAVARARADAEGLRRALRTARTASEVLRILRGIPEPVLAWAHAGSRGRVRRAIERYLGQWRAVRPLLTGEDLRALGLEPGPRYAALLEGLVEAQVAGRVRSRAEALRWVRGRLARRPEAGTRPRPAGGREGGG